MTIESQCRIPRLCAGCSKPIPRGYKGHNDDRANNVYWCATCTLLEDMRHTHTLDDIVGYRVVETPTNREVAWFASNRYASAVEVADSIRTNPAREWAVIDNHYSCGCVSVARAPGEVSILDT